MLRKPHDQAHAPCHHVRLAQSGVGEICYCPDCGVVHVALQYFTMRFELEAFKALQTMLSEAQHKITQHARTTTATADPYAAANGDGTYTSVVH